MLLFVLFALLCVCVALLCSFVIGLRVVCFLSFLVLLFFSARVCVFVVFDCVLVLIVCVLFFCVLVCVWCLNVCVLCLLVFFLYLFVCLSGGVLGRLFCVCLRGLYIVYDFFGRLRLVLFVLLLFFKVLFASVFVVCFCGFVGC